MGIMQLIISVNHARQAITAYQVPRQHVHQDIVLHRLVLLVVASALFVM